MRAISPAIMRVIRETPPELKARELARLTGVRESDAASYLGASVVSKNAKAAPSVVTGKPVFEAYRQLLELRQAQEKQAKYEEAFQMWRAKKTRAQIAEHFGISPDTATKWVQRGRNA